MYVSFNMEYKQEKKVSTNLLCFLLNVLFDFIIIAAAVFYCIF